MQNEAQPSARVKAAIIGLGRIASILEEDARREKPCTHAGALSANHDCVIAAGCDTDEERRSLFANRWGAAVYADASEMIRAIQPELLVIATHPDSHFHYCNLAAEKGVPVVVCEKPLADTLSNAGKIVRLVNDAPEKKRITILTNHERRYSADYIEAKRILSSGVLGQLLGVRSVLCFEKDRRLLDVLWHDGTHMADVMMFLTGAGLKHRRQWGAKLNSNRGTARIEGELVTPNGAENSGRREPVPFVMEIGAERDHLIFEAEFSCTKGRLRIGNGVFEVWESDESPYAENFRSLKKTRSGFEGPTGFFANMMVDAVACVRDPNREPASSAEDGLKVIKYLNSIKTWR